jgi:hypothetical protein
VFGRTEAGWGGGEGYNCECKACKTHACSCGLSHDGLVQVSNMSKAVVLSQGGCAVHARMQCSQMQLRHSQPCKLKLLQRVLYRGSVHDNPHSV